MKKILIILLVLGLIISIGFNVMGDYKRFNFKNRDYIQHDEIATDILVDNKTGVNYLVLRCMHVGAGWELAITPMYDSNGKILVEK
jgi:hypothetical protein